MLPNVLSCLKVGLHGLRRLRDNVVLDGVRRPLLHLRDWWRIGNKQALTIDKSTISKQDILYERHQAACRAYTKGLGTANRRGFRVEIGHACSCILIRP